MKVDPVSFGRMSADKEDLPVIASVALEDNRWHVIIETKYDRL